MLRGEFLTIHQTFAHIATYIKYILVFSIDKKTKFNQKKNYIFSWSWTFIPKWLFFHSHLNTSECVPSVQIKARQGIWLRKIWDSHTLLVNERFNYWLKDKDFPDFANNCKFHLTIHSQSLRVNSEWRIGNFSPKSVSSPWIKRIKFICKCQSIEIFHVLFGVYSTD